MYELALFSLSLAMGFFYGFAFKDLYDDYKHDPTTVVFDEAVEYVDIDNGRLVLKQDIMNAFIDSIANDDPSNNTSNGDYVDIDGTVFLKEDLVGAFRETEETINDHIKHLNEGDNVQINNKIYSKEDLLQAWHDQLANDEIRGGMKVNTPPIEPIKHIRDTFAEEVQPEELSMHNWEGYAEWLDEVDNNYDKRGI